MYLIICCFIQMHTPTHTHAHTQSVNALRNHKSLIKSIPAGNFTTSILNIAYEQSLNIMRFGSYLAIFKESIPFFDSAESSWADHKITQNAQFV